VVLFLFNVLKLALRGPTNHDCFSIAGRGNFFVKNTGRVVVWVEKRCSKQNVDIQLNNGFNTSRSKKKFEQVLQFNFCKSYDLKKAPIVKRYFIFKVFFIQTIVTYKIALNLYRIILLSCRMKGYQLDFIYVRAIKIDHLTVTKLYNGSKKLILKLD